MDTIKIGKLICKLRKGKNLTQRELGDILGVSSKTISKWECGSGLPDISIIKKISKELDISLEELLDGVKKESVDNEIKNKGKKIFFIICFCILLLFGILFLIFRINNNSDVLVNNCTVIRTYDIDNIRNSNDENYMYVTVSEFQVEGVFTIKLFKLEAEKLEEGSSYEFTFKTNENNVNSNADILFTSADIINIEYTDKVGFDRVSKYYCE